MMNPAKRDPIARLDNRIEEWFQDHPVLGMIILMPVSIVIAATIVVVFRVYYG